MPSSFTWLDYSERERRTMLDVVRLFHEQDTRDELGIGNVRDAFADLLFPGTSTIQTRARYFLFIPWMYQHLEARRIRSADIAVAARQYEIGLITALSNSLDTDGIIGSRAGAGLKRLPSNIYWQGVGRFGIRLFPGSQDQYHHALDTFYETSQRRRTRVEEGDPADTVTPRNWHAGLPAPPDDFPQRASLKLTVHEADYLREQVMTHAPGTLLAVLLDHAWDALDVDAPWYHPHYGEFPKHVRDQLEHARCFAEVIHGAALLYNLMLAEVTRHAKGEEWRMIYRKDLSHWATMIEERSAAFAAWDLPWFWKIIDAQPVSIAPSTRIFISQWIKFALTPGGAKTIADNKHARHLIHDRERILKRSLARLDNPRSLELWSGAAGTQPLRYRWQTALQFVADLVNGLRKTDA